MNVNDLLFEICEDKNVYDDNFDLIESGVLDSYAIIELFSKLEDINITIHPTQIKLENLRTPAKIKEMVKNYER